MPGWFKRHLTDVEVRVMWRSSAWTPIVVALLVVLGVVALARHQWLYAVVLLGLGTARAIVLVRAGGLRR